MAQAIQISLHNFQTAIVEASASRTVVLVFTSARYPECGETRASLEKLSEELHFDLGEVNLDDPENQAFIRHFQISGLPEIRVIDKGEIADAIQGVADERTLKERLGRFFLSEEDSLKTQIERALEEKDFPLALELLNALLLKNPEDKKLRLLSARALLGISDIEKAKEILTAFTPGDECYDEAKNHLELLEFFAEASKTDEVAGEASIYRRACVFASEGNYREALSLFLEIISKNRDWENGKAHKAMLSLFGVLGKKHALTWEFRAKLNTLWFV